MSKGVAGVVNKVQIRDTLGNLIDPSTSELQTSLNNLVTTSNTLLSSIGTNTDQIEPKIDAVTTAITAFNTSFSSRDLATQTTLAQVKLDTAKLDITLSTLRDAIRGSSNRDITTLQTAVAAVQSSVDTFKTAFDARDLTTSVIQGTVDDSLPITTTEGSTGPLRMSPKRDLHAVLYHSDGTEVTGAAPLSATAQLSDENGVPFSNANPLPVSVGDLSIQTLNVTFPDSVVSTSNSTATPLGANGNFTGAWEDIKKYAGVTVIIITDQASATNGAIAQFSSDGVNLDRSVAATIPANVGLSFVIGPEARYFRINYTNGVVAQGIMRAQVIYHYQPPVPAQLPLAATTTDVSLGQSALSHIKGRSPSGLWVPILVDSTGNQAVTVVSSALPSGASTETTLAAIKAKTDNLDVLLSTRTKPADQQHTIVDSSALPSGAAQEHTAAATPSSTRLSDGAAFYDAAKTGQLPTALTGGGALKVDQQSALPAGANTIGKVDQGSGGASPWKVDGSGVTQPVSGTVTTTPSGTQDENVKQVGGTAVDVNAGNASAGTQRVVLASDQPVVPINDNGGSVTVDAPVGTPVFARLSDGTAALTTTGGRLAVDGSGVTQPVSAVSLPLPALAATSTKQSDGTQKTQVVDASGNVQPAGDVVGRAIKVDGSGATQPVSGTVTANAGTNLNTSALALEAGGNLASIKADVDNLALAQESTTAGQKGNLALGAVTTGAPTYTTGKSDPLSLTTTGALRIDGSGTTQPISAVTLPLPTGASQEHTTAASPSSTRLSDGSAFYDATKTGQLPPALGATTADNETDSGNAALIVKNRSYIYDEAGANWDRTRSVGGLGDGDDGLAVEASGLMAYNGTTFDRLQTDKGQVTGAPAGLLKTRLFDGDTGQKIRIDARQHLLTANSFRIVGDSLDGSTIDANIWITTVTGSGTVTASGGVGTLATGTTANSTANLLSAAYAKFLGGSTYRAILGIILGDTGTANNVRRWGAYSTTSGCFVELNGTTLKLVTRNASVDTAITSGFFTGTNPTLDTNIHVWEIYYSPGAIFWFFDGTLIHKSTFATTTWTDIYDLPVQVDNVNSGGSTTNISIKGRDLCINRLGGLSGIVASADQSAPGSLPYNNTALSNTKQTAKATQARLYGIHGYNSGIAVAYVQFFNKLAANVTVGTTAPDYVIALPVSGGIDRSLPVPLEFNVGIVVAATTTATGSTAPATAVLLNLEYR